MAFKHGRICPRAAAPDSARSSARRRPRRRVDASLNPNNSPRLRRRPSARSTPGSGAARSTTRPSPFTSPGSTMRGRAAAGFRARLAGQPPPAGPRTAHLLAGLPAGQAPPFSTADLAAVLATCHRPRPRGRGLESEAARRRSGPPRRSDRRAALHGGMVILNLGSAMPDENQVPARRRRRARPPPAAGGGMNGDGVRPRPGGAELPVEHPPPRVVVSRGDAPRRRASAAA